ncbi:MAG: radical SAM family heme chaperone HemW [Alphaproteobacteria bacterium]
MTKTLALYVHWPFCVSKCPYCDFNSHVRAQVDEQAWERALLHELQRVRELTGSRQLTSIFFGGGTPSLMQPQTVAAVIDKAVSLYTTHPDLEITLEANPQSTEIARFQQFAEAGVNRVSIGVQSFDEDALRFLGRGHDSSEAIRAITTAQGLFGRVSFDLIYARPEQTLDQWQAELTQALGFGTEHLSVYQLTIEQGTAFATQHARQDFLMPDEEQAGDFYELTQSILAEAGLPAYEISNHARKGAASQHNVSYWRYQDYAGVGPGAHGRLTLADARVATRQVRAPELWLESVATKGHGDADCETLSLETQGVEALMMGLRLTEGIDTSELPRPLEQIVNLQALELLKSKGFLQQEAGHLSATSAGLQRLNAVLAKLLS